MADDDEHFVKPAKRLSVLVRDSNYRDNTPHLSWMKAEDVQWQAHHILCNHSVESRTFPPEDVVFAEDCLWITDWNLNARHNMVGLPLNRQYRETDGKVPVNKPSHQVDHNTTDGYTDECTDWLKTNVWDKIKDKGKNHKANAENMKELLKGGSTHFRTLLGERGCRKEGTAHCWSHRFEDPPAGVPKAGYKQEKKWYFPFSMASNANVNERQPGVDWDELVGVLRKIA